MKKVALTLLTQLVLLVTMTSVVLADGEQQTETKETTKQVCTTSYGGVTECRDEVVREEIIREVETGMAEILLVASGLFAGGFGLFVMAQKQLTL